MEFNESVEPKEAHCQVRGVCMLVYVSSLVSPLVDVSYSKLSLCATCDRLLIRLLPWLRVHSHFHVANSSSTAVAVE